MMRLFIPAMLAAVLSGCCVYRTAPENNEVGGATDTVVSRKVVTHMEMLVKKTEDFELTGDGSAPQWQKAEWQPLSLVNGNSSYKSQMKVLYSETGIYFLADFEDKLLKCTMTEDFDNIFTEDVCEVFLWPLQDEAYYFEYEISPLDVELPILVGNHDGKFFGWRPWHYENERLTRTATAVRGGEKKSMAKIEGWTAEFFIPYALLRGIGNVPPESGDTWRANMYRIDYDQESACQWAWEPATGSNFHNYKQFGTITFE